jgi:hypothetical protein
MFFYFIKVIRKLGLGIWIALGGAFIGIAAGLFASLASGSYGGTVVVFLMSFGFCWVFWTFMFRPMAEAERLNEVGIEAEATIRSVRENGSSLQIGGQVPKAGVTIELDVRPKDRAAFTATTNTYISMFEMQSVQPGNKVRVKFDPADPQRLILAQGTDPLGAFGAGTPKT